MKGWTVGQYGVILHTTDGGANWVPQTSGTKNYLSSTVFINAQTGWAVGQSGTVLGTTDGGSHWALKPSGVNYYLLSVFFLDSQTGWVVGDHGSILKTTNGGGLHGTQDMRLALTVPDRFSLDQNYPNPFNPSTTIRYNLAARTVVKLTVYNITGQVVARLLDEEQPSGQHEIRWNANSLPSGVYFARLQAASFNQTRKLMLLK